MQKIYDFIQAHRGAIELAGAWAIREAHMLWPAVRPSVALSWLESRGGLWGICVTIAVGKTPGRTAAPSDSAPAQR